MRNIILTIILIVALLFGGGSVIYYNIQDYEYSLDLSEQIPTSEVFITPSPQTQFGNIFGALLNNSNIVQTPPMIQSFSVILGEMNFENKGSLSRVIEVPRLVGCVDLFSTPSFASTNNPSTIKESTAYWTIYSTNKPSFGASPSAVPFPVVVETPSEIYPQYNYAQDGNHPSIEIRKGEKLKYYIYLKDAYVNSLGNSSKDLRNAQIKVYDVPLKNNNPLAEEYNYNYFAYSPSCSVLERDLEPLQTITIV